MMAAAESVKQRLTKPIQLADQVIKAAEEASLFKMECGELRLKAEKIAALLRQAARTSSDLYERPTRRIIDETEQVLEKALALGSKCRGHGVVKRLFPMISAANFKKMSYQMENSIGDVSWLLRVSASGDDRGEFLGLPPIAANEPILGLIWEQIATLYTGSPDERTDAAASLVSLARNNDRYGKLIIEEGGIPPLLKLIKEGRLEGQESAAQAIGRLGRDPESIEQMIQAGVCSVFAKVLKEGPMKLQSMVAWAVAELASNYPKCQDLFAQSNCIRLLVSHLAFETIQEHSKYVITHNTPPLAPGNFHNNPNSASAKGMSMHTVITSSMANSKNQQNLIQNNPSPAQSQMHSLVSSTLAARNQNQQEHQPQQQVQVQHQQITQNGNAGTNKVSLAVTSMKGREYEDPETKSSMKAMAALALSKLARRNVAICRSITESRALLCFAVLLEKGTEDVKLNSAMALMEISAVAETDAELRRSAFKPNSPAAKAVLEQLLRIVGGSDPDVLVPCVRAIGCLARTFPARETPRIIPPLVQLLDDQEAAVMREAAIALTKFSEKGNYLHEDHCKAIVEAEGVKHLIQLVYLGDVQMEALLLLCWLAYGAPEFVAQSHPNALTVLEWASKQGALVQDPIVEVLLPQAKGRLEVYQSRGGGLSEGGFY